MVAAVAITRTELDAAGLRRAAGRERDAAASRRMLALALVLAGQSRTEAARAAGMDRQTLRDWVSRDRNLGRSATRRLAGWGGRRSGVARP
jgi:transposase